MIWECFAFGAVSNGDFNHGFSRILLFFFHHFFISFWRFKSFKDQFLASISGKKPLKIHAGWFSIWMNYMTPVILELDHPHYTGPQVSAMFALVELDSARIYVNNSC